MENKFKVGQKVRIVPKAQLVELAHNGEDIARVMFEYGGKEATIIEASNHWLFEDLPEYKLNIDESEWVWYENLLEPIE